MKKYVPASFQMKFLLVVLVILVIGDGVVTHFLITRGLANESNPLLVDMVGEDKFLVIKVAGALLAAYILWDVYRKWAKLAFFSTSFFVVVYTVIVSWNLHFLFR